MWYRVMWSKKLIVTVVIIVLSAGETGLLAGRSNQQTMPNLPAIPKSAAVTKGAVTQATMAPTATATATTTTSASAPAPAATTGAPAVTAPATTAATPKTTTGTGAGGFVPPDGIGFYEGCAPDLGQVCLDRLKTMAAAGFTIVLNYSQNSGTAAQEITYLNTAHALGMKVIWAMSNHAFWNGGSLRATYPELAKSCGCTDNAGFIRYVVNLVKGNPGLWGYYVGDELFPSVHAQWLSFTNLVHTTDPNHPRLFVGGIYGGMYGDPDLPAFADGSEVLGLDYYPIGDDGLVPYTQTGNVAQTEQAMANRVHRDSAMVLQSLSWQQVYPPARCQPWPSCAPFPSRTQLQQMLHMVLQNSQPRLVLWYSYFNLLQENNAAQHWSDIVAASQIGMHR
jgi:hypothetical protein